MKSTVINLYGGPGTGKCLEKSTKVLMYDGSIKKADELKIGDLLMGPDSLPRPIKDLEYGTAPLFRLTAKNGNYIDITENHIIPLVHSGKKNSRVDGQRFDFTVKEYNELPSSWKEKLKVFFSNAIDFKTQDLIIDPYLLGCWLGDGNKNSTKICGIDPEPFLHIEKLLPKYNCFLVNYNYKSGKCLDYVIKSKDDQFNFFRRALKQLNIWNNKHIPKEYIINSRENRLLLLAGLIDTDGHYNKKGKAYDICTISLNMANDIKYIAQSLGYYANVVVKNNADQNGTVGTYYSINILGDDLDQIPCQIPRKKATKRTINKNVLRSGFSLRQQGVGDYVGIIIDDSAPNKLFILDNFMVTHNSTSAAKIFAHMKDKKESVELVREFVKDWAWDGKTIQHKHQLTIFAEQAAREGLLYGKVKNIVTDSPLILSEIYEKRYFKKAIMTDGLYARWLELNQNDAQHIHVVILRSKEYDPKGRYENEEQAKEMDKIIVNHLSDFCLAHGHSIYTVGYDSVVEDVESILKLYKEV